MSVKNVLAVALGILSAIGGFVDIGDLVFNTQAGATFGYQLLWVVVVGVVGIIVYSEMCGRVAAVSKRPVFDLVRERVGFGAGLGTLIASPAQAQRNGGQVDKVAASHALRIMLVVLIVPFAFNAMNVHGLDPYAPLAKTFSWTGFIVLVAITAAAAAVMERFKSPNSWMIGPLLAAALVTATGHSFSTFPAGVVNAGQLLIGISLGSRFTPEFFGAAPRFLSAVAAISLLYMVLAAGFAGLLARGSGLPWPTATIATTPGGIGEMALTAQALQLGVPIVTAFHTIRLLALLLTVGAMYRYWRKWMVRRAS